jgi:hypothetical protein
VDEGLMRSVVFSVFEYLAPARGALRRACARQGEALAGGAHGFRLTIAFLARLYIIWGVQTISNVIFRRGIPAFREGRTLASVFKAAKESFPEIWLFV